MDIPPQLIDRLADAVRRRNRELAFDAALKAGLGIVFSLVAFGMLFWFGWVVGFFVNRSYAWQLGVVVAGVFFVTASLSAWRRVDPLADLAPLGDAEMVAMLIGRASGFMVFSPRHALAGAALVLLGGPAGVFEALGIWAHRLRADDELIRKAAKVLVLCEATLPQDEIGDFLAAVLLWRLALIKPTVHGDSAALVPTDKGWAMLAKKKAQRARAN